MRLERNEKHLERNESCLTRNETRGGNLLLSGTVCRFFVKKSSVKLDLLKWNRSPLNLKTAMEIQIPFGKR